MDEQARRTSRLGRCLGLLSVFLILSLASSGAEEKKSAPVLKKENFRRSLPVKEESLKQAYASLEESVELKKTPGAVCIITVKGIVSKPRAFGHAQLVTSDNGTTAPLERKMEPDMIFDLASLTKQVATNTSVMQLVEAGKLDLDKTVASYVPEFGQKGKENVTVRMLITHTSGFVAWIPFWKDLVGKPDWNTTKGKEYVFKKICETELNAPPMTRRVYSDLNFITLGMLVERVSGQPLDAYTKEHIFDPLGMKYTMYNPPEKLRNRCPATELSPDSKEVKVGQVHDENALAMGGVSGHAGLFSTAEDLAIFCQMILNGGIYGKVQILKPETVDMYFTLQTSPELSKIQAIGWLLGGSTAGSTGGLGPGSIGHTGFTGTSIWMNREAQAFGILLTNAIHPKRENAQNSYFRRRFYGHLIDALDLPKLEPTQALLDTDEQWVSETLAGLTLREKAAQILCPWVGQDWEKARKEFAEMQYGGLVFFFDDAAKAAHELNLMQKGAKVPILVHGDMERGLGTYVNGCTDFPGNMALGAGGLDSDAYWMGRITAQEARAVGIHVNFAPVMDVNNNPNNPIINVRSFGEDPKLVARLGVAFAHGLQGAGVIATAKHFPGHGNTATDSHAALAKIDSDSKQLRAIELYPFERAVRDGHVRAVMSAHLWVPAVESQPIPATLSSKIMSGILRKEMGFKGIVYTDAMDMGGVTKEVSYEEGLVRALNAGCDVLLMPGDPRKAVDAIEQAVKDGRVTEQRLDEAVRRVLAAKTQVGINRERFVDENALKDRIGLDSYQEFAVDMARNSVTLVRDDVGLLPLDPAKKIAVIGMTNKLGRVMISKDVFAVGDDIKKRAKQTETIFLGDDVTAEERTQAMKIAEDADVIVLPLYAKIVLRRGNVSLNPDQEELVRSLARLKKPIIVVAAGSPYVINEIPRYEAALVLFSNAEVSQEAAARALFGEIPIRGRSPVALGPDCPFGFGIARAKK